MFSHVCKNSEGQIIETSHNLKPCRYPFAQTVNNTMPNQKNENHLTMFAAGLQQHVNFPTLPVSGFIVDTLSRLLGDEVSAIQLATMFRGFSGDKPCPGLCRNPHRLLQTPSSTCSRCPALAQKPLSWPSRSPPHATHNTQSCHLSISICCS